MRIPLRVNTFAMGVCALLGCAWACAAPSDISRFSPEDAQFVAFSQPIIAFTHIRVVDGTGSEPRANMTVVVREGRIEGLGASGVVTVPKGATVIDGSGKTLLPGFVMMHQHMYFTSTKPGQFGEFPYSFSRLYLAGGITTMRTAGSLSVDADLNTRDAIESGQQPGPDIDVTGPYFEAPPIPTYKIPVLKSPTQAIEMVNFWADMGVTSFKVYQHITRAELRAIVDAAHARGIKVTGHLCSITFREAAEIGIDNLEHGFLVATDFVPDKKPDECPAAGKTRKSLDSLDPDSPAATQLMQLLIDKGIPLTSTLSVVEILTPGRPKISDRALALLMPELQAAYEETWNRYQRSPSDTITASTIPQIVRLDRKFVRMGGTLLVGTDTPGPGGGVIPGFGARRELEIMVQEGFSFPAALKAATLNGARYLGRNANIGSIEPGKRADLVVINGDPTTDIMALQNMPLVFKAGIGYRTDKIFESLRGKIGLY
jgi:imidazolonepropionase-like amidohydrolase